MERSGGILSYPYHLRWIEVLPQEERESVILSREVVSKLGATPLGELHKNVIIFQYQSAQLLKQNGQSPDS